MKKTMLLLLYAMLVFTACNGNSEPKTIAEDSARKNAADSFNYNPAAPGAQNSDDPDRFSQ